MIRRGGVKDADTERVGAGPDGCALVTSTMMTPPLVITITQECFT